MNIKRKKKRIVQEIIKCQDMLQGSLEIIYRRCGKKSCRCYRGEGIKHPGYYLSFKRQGKSRLIYISQKQIKEVEKGLRAFQRYWQLGLELSDINLELMKEKKR